MMVTLICFFLWTVELTMYNFGCEIELLNTFFYGEVIIVIEMRRCLPP